jgi:hypothetical protein
VAFGDPAGHACPGAHTPLHTPPRAVLLLQVPAAQSAHTAAPSRLYRPAGQATDVATEDPAGHMCPALHSSVHGVGRALTALHVPGAHGMHSRAPTPLYCPGGHATAVLLGDPAGHTWPASQSLHLLAPGGLYRPAGHTDTVALGDPAGHTYPALQLLTHGVDRAMLLLHVPASQSVHAPAAAKLYFPAGHVTACALVDPGGHAAPAWQSTHAGNPVPLYRPAGHTDAIGLVDPAGQKWPERQGPEHSGDDNPGVLPNLPTIHKAHDPAPAGLYEPAGHRAAVALVAPSGHAYPGVHTPSHATARPASPAHVPARQLVQASAPASLYCPAGHRNTVALGEPAGHAYPALQLLLHGVVRATS